MRELRLRQDRVEPRLFALDGVGTLRFRGFTRRDATATAGGESWDLRFRAGALKASVEATDAQGVVVGRLASRAFRRGGTLHWPGRAIAIRPKGAWRQRYYLVEGDRTLGHLAFKALGDSKVRVFLEDDVEIEPGFLLFVVFTGRALAKAASGAAAVVAAG